MSGEYYYHAFTGPFTVANAATSLRALEFMLTENSVRTDLPAQLWRNSKTGHFMFTATTGGKENEDRLRFDMLATNWFPAFFTEDGN